MIKRTPKDKINLYRRHAGNCEHADVKLGDACECVIWAHGKLNGNLIRRSMDTRSLGTAELTKKRWLNNGATDEESAVKKSDAKVAANGQYTLTYTQQKFLAAKARLARVTLQAYEHCVQHFREWAEAQGIEMLTDLNSLHVEDYFTEYGGTWERRTATQKLKYIRIWLNYCVEKNFIQRSPAFGRSLTKMVGTGKTHREVRLPFTVEEVGRIVAAIDLIEDPGERIRARALVLLLLFSGCRISDATFMEREYLNPKTNMLNYWVIKTRKKIALAPELNQMAVDALNALPPSRVYFFQPDVDDNYRAARRALRDGRNAKEEFRELMPDYVSRVRRATELVIKVRKLAGLTDDELVHRFRDTFAVSALTAGVDLFTVSQFLGHSDVQITKDHYVKLIEGYQENLSQATRKLTYGLSLNG